MLTRSLAPVHYHSYAMGEHLGSSRSLTCLGYGKGEEIYSTHAHVSLHGANSCMRGGSDTNDPPWEDRSADTHACRTRSACRHLSTYPLGEAAERQGREQDVRTGKGQGEASKAKDAKQAKPN
jgi:hypothetical protein